MRLEVEFITDKKKRLNFNYNYYITSAIYNLLAEYDEDYSKFLHDEGYMVGNKNFKLFVYSRFMPERFSVSDNYMTIKKGKSRLFINSPVKEFINSLGNSLIKKGCLNIGEEEYKINNVYLRDDISHSYETEFIALSPIVVTTGVEINGEVKPRTVYIDEPKFIENIKNNLLKKYFLVHGRLPENMSIDIEFNKQYIERSNRGHLINFKGISIKGFIAPFVMRCEESVKKVAIDCGIGENNSIGMGYIKEVKNRNRV